MAGITPPYTDPDTGFTYYQGKVIPPREPEDTTGKPKTFGEGLYIPIKKRYPGEAPTNNREENNEEQRRLIEIWNRNYAPYTGAPTVTNWAEYQRITQREKAEFQASGAAGDWTSAIRMERELEEHPEYRSGTSRYREMAARAGYPEAEYPSEFEDLKSRGIFVPSIYEGGPGVGSSYKQPKNLNLGDKEWARMFSNREVQKWATEAAAAPPGMKEPYKMVEGGWGIPTIQDLMRVGFEPNRAAQLHAEWMGKGWYSQEAAIKKDLWYALTKSGGYMVVKGGQLVASSSQAYKVPGLVAEDMPKITRQKVWDVNPAIEAVRNAEKIAAGIATNIPGVRVTSVGSEAIKRATITGKSFYHSTEKATTYPIYQILNRLSTTWTGSVVDPFTRFVSSPFRNVTPTSLALWTGLGGGNPALGKAWHKTYTEAATGFLKSPGSVAEFVGMVPPGAEMLARDIKNLPSYAMAGGALQVESITKSWRESPAGTIGELAGMYAIFGGMSEVTKRVSSSVQPKIVSARAMAGSGIEQWGAIRATSNLFSKTRGIESRFKVEPDLTKVVGVGSKGPALTKTIGEYQHSIFGRTTEIGQMPKEAITERGFTYDVDIFVQGTKKFKTATEKIVPEGVLDVHPFPEKYPIGKPEVEITPYPKKTAAFDYLPKTPKDLLKGQTLTQEKLYIQTGRKATSVMGQPEGLKWKYGPEAHRLKDVVDLMRYGNFLKGELEIKTAKSSRLNIPGRIIGSYKASQIEKSVQVLGKYWAKEGTSGKYGDAEIYVPMIKRLTTGKPLTQEMTRTIRTSRVPEADLPIPKNYRSPSGRYPSYPSAIPSMPYKYKSPSSMRSSYSGTISKSILKNISKPPSVSALSSKASSIGYPKRSFSVSKSPSIKSVVPSSPYSYLKSPPSGTSYKTKSPSPSTTFSPSISPPSRITSYSYHPPLPYRQPKTNILPVIKTEFKEPMGIKPLMASARGWKIENPVPTLKGFGFGTTKKKRKRT